MKIVGYQKPMTQNKTIDHKLSKQELDEMFKVQKSVEELQSDLDENRKK